MKTLKNFNRKSNNINIKFPWTIFDKNNKSELESDIDIKSDTDNLNETLMTTIWF